MTNKPGTPPNTSLILTPAELDYINRNFNGSKSAAIHAALGAMMNTQRMNDVIDRFVGSMGLDEVAEVGVEELTRQIQELIDENGWDASGFTARQIAEAIIAEAAKNN